MPGSYEGESSIKFDMSLLSSIKFDMSLMIEGFPFHQPVLPSLESSNPISISHALMAALKMLILDKKNKHCLMT